MEQLSSFQISTIDKVRRKREYDAYSPICAIDKRDLKHKDNLHYHLDCFEGKAMSLTSFIDYPHWHILPASKLLNFKRHNTDSRPYDIRLDEISYRYLMKRIDLPPQEPWIPTEALINNDPSAVGDLHRTRLAGGNVESDQNESLSIDTSLTRSSTVMRLALDSGVPDLGTTNHRLHRQSNNPGLSPENTLPLPDQEPDDPIDDFYTIFDDDNLTTSSSTSEATESQEIVETSPAEDRTPDSVLGISTGRASQETGHRLIIDLGDQSESNSNTPGGELMPPETYSDLEITSLNLSTPARKRARNLSPNTPEIPHENTPSINPGANRQISSTAVPETPPRAWVSKPQVVYSLKFGSQEGKNALGKPKTSQVDSNFV